MRDETIAARRANAIIALENVRVARPCKADWNRMDGDERVRFCQSCAKNVYNLSAMSKAEGQMLIERNEGHLCVRYFQRADGTILTSDCPVAVRTARRPFKWVILGFIGFALSWGMAQGSGDVAGRSSSDPSTYPEVVDKLYDVPVVGIVVRLVYGSRMQGGI